MSSDSLNLMMPYTVDDDIFKVLPVSCWWMLFWNYSTICSYSFLQIAEPLPMSEILYFCTQQCYWPVASNLIGSEVFFQLCLCSTNYFFMLLLPCPNFFELHYCHQIYHEIITYRNIWYDLYFLLLIKFGILRFAHLVSSYPLLSFLTFLELGVLNKSNL